MTYPSPITRLRSSQAAVSAGSGFVLILVLPVALLLIMTALSLVTRSNSAAITSNQESRAQAARMAAEYGFNQLMALVNTEYDSSNPTPLVIGNQIAIPDSPGASYTILSYDYTPPVASCGTSNTDFRVTVEGKYTVNSVDFKRNILRTLSVCIPASNTNKLRVRGFK